MHKGFFQNNNKGFQLLSFYRIIAVKGEFDKNGLQRDENASH